MGLTTAFAGLVAVAGVSGVATVVPAAAIPAASTAASGATLLSTGSSVAPAGFAAALPANPADGAAATGRGTAIATTQSTATGPTGTPAAATPSRMAAQPTPPAASAAIATPPAAPPGDDGNRRGPDGINVNGRPDNFDAGDRGAVYLWHGPDGWHLRTTDISDTAHHYTGTIGLSAGARWTSFAPVRLENDDRVWVDGENVLYTTSPPTAASTVSTGRYQRATAPATARPCASPWTSTAVRTIHPASTSVTPSSTPTPHRST